MIDTITPLETSISVATGETYCRLITCIKTCDDTSTLQIIIDPFILKIRSQLMQAINAAGYERMSGFLHSNSFVINRTAIKNLSFANTFPVLMEQSAYIYPDLSRRVSNLLIISSVESFAQPDDFSEMRRFFFSIGTYIQKVALPNNEGFIVLAAFSIVT